MTEEIYLSRLEKGIKVMRTYDIMIHGQGNYKTLPHYMKAFGDFCVDYLKYKVIVKVPELHHAERVSELLSACKANHIEVVNMIADHANLIQDSKEAKYTDVAECMKVMPETTGIMTGILKDLNMEM